MYSNVTTSTTINSSSVHTYICVCFIRNQYMSSFYTGFVDPNQYSTWCQNRGCICISSTRRTYRSNPADSCIHPSILKQFYKTFNSGNRIISSRRREERDSSASSQSSNTVIPTAFPVFPHTIQQVSSHPVQGNYSTYRINSSTRILQEIPQLQSSSHADTYKASSSDCSHTSKHSTQQNKAPEHPIAIQAPLE